MPKFRPVYFLCFSLVSLFSCRNLAPNRMFETPKDYAFAVDTPPQKDKYFIISPEDRVEMYIFSNDGFRLVDITGMSSVQNDQSRVNYLVDRDSLVRLPIVGKVKLGGLTVAEAEKKLEEIYSKYYNDPYIVLKLINRYAIVFQGDGGQGHLVSLENDNVTLMEVLAQGGGVPELGKAYHIKILRGDLKNPLVYRVDLSTLDGLSNSPLRIQSNDIVYVEAVPNYRLRVINQITPILGIVSAVVLIINLSQR
jgi:polysaccharide export outer membrane protein